MHLEEFAKGESLLHRLDPRGKLLLFLIFSFFCILSNSLIVIFLYFTFSVFLITLARPSLKALLKRLLLINFFTLLIWLSLLLGDLFSAYISSQSLHISRETLQLALRITFKSNALFLATIALIATSSLQALAHALIHFKISSKLVMTFFLSYRYLSLLHEEYDKLKLGLKAKGFRPKTSIFTYWIYANLFGMLILKTLNKSEELYRAMLARGYRENFPLLHHFHFHLRDYLFLIAGSSIILLIYWLEAF